MKYLTNDKLTIVGAGGMIGSNMVQTALMLGLTPNICLYDIFEPGVHGVAEEMAHCAFEGANITWTTDPKVAFKNAKYIISSGGAPRKEGMTREDLLKGNCQIAAQFGDYIKEYCPKVKHVVVIFNPADVTALTALIHSGLKPDQLTSLAALDSTRLQEALADAFKVQQSKVKGACTRRTQYGAVSPRGNFRLPTSLNSLPASRGRRLFSGLSCTTGESRIGF